jgi:hypothetical protein
VYWDVTTEIAEIKRKARVVAAVGVLMGGVVPGLLGIAAMSTAQTTPYRAEKLTAIAWLSMIVGWLTLAAFLVMLALGVVTHEEGTP